MNSIQPKSEKRTRFAIYARYSSEMQNELSLEAQEYCCRQAIAERGGVVVGVYLDSAKSGWSLDREGFQQMRTDAEHGKFESIMFWKFDRLARNHDHAVMIKMLLRNEYRLKLHCVEGFSEDDDDSPYSSMMEQMLAVIAAFYSKNLSSETKRGKRQRAIKGEFNGSVAPLGYELVLKDKTTPERPAGLHINPREAVIIRKAFRMYATGEYSDTTLAQWLQRQQPIIQKCCAGERLNMNKEAVRHMLQNKVYTGRVSHSDTQYNGSLGERRKTSRHRKEWFEGKHPAFIPDDLFEQCRQVRAKMARTFKTEKMMRTYTLHDRVYCARCVATKPQELVDERYGKMRVAWVERDQLGQYRCVARDRGYHKCAQSAVPDNVIDEQVVASLSQLVIPDGFRERVEEAVRGRVENEAALKRMAEIQTIVERINFSWEQGFLSAEEYIDKRSQLQKEMEALRPVDYESLMEAADLIEHFNHYWQACETVDHPALARQQLVAKIVDRVFVYDRNVIAIALPGDFGIVLDASEVAPVEIVSAVSTAINKKGANPTAAGCTQDGLDGSRTRDLRLDRPTC